MRRIPNLESSPKVAQSMFIHPITHHYQPTNFTCGHAAAAMVLSFFKRDILPNQLIEEARAIRSSSGEVCGMLTQYIGSWGLRNGFDASLYAADFELLDLAWAKLSRKELLQRMSHVKGLRDVPSLGKETSTLYLESYIEFLENGGHLKITPCITTKLLNDLLVTSPLLICVAYSVLYGIGRTRSIGLRETVEDDVNGSLTAHAIVAYGRDAQGNYLIADPWRAPGFHVIDAEHLVVSIAAAQFTCEASVLQFKTKS